MNIHVCKTVSFVLCVNEKCYQKDTNLMDAIDSVNTHQHNHHIWSVVCEQ